MDLTKWEHNYLVGILAKAARNSYWHGIQGQKRRIIYAYVHDLLRDDSDRTLEDRYEYMLGIEFDEKEFKEAKEYVKDVYRWIDEAKQRRDKADKAEQEILDGAPYDIAIIPYDHTDHVDNMKELAEKINYNCVIDVVGHVGSRFYRHEDVLETPIVILVTNKGYELRWNDDTHVCDTVDDAVSYAAELMEL